MAEAQCAQLSATLDKLLAESHDRLQSHYREKMVLVDERNRVAGDADKCRKMLEGALSEKVRLRLCVRVFFCFCVRLIVCLFSFKAQLRLRSLAEM